MSEVLLVEPDNFVRVIASGYEEYGLQKGEVVFVAGKIDSPVSEEDPYLFRRLFVLCGFNEEGLEVGDRGLITISGLALEPLPEEENEALIEKLLKSEDDSIN